MTRGMWKLAMLLVMQLYPPAPRKIKPKRPHALPLSKRQQYLLNLFKEAIRYAKEHANTED